MECLFCKIANGEIPCYKIFENDFAISFLDVHPCSKGHAVIIPKKHFNNLSEFTEKEWREMTSVIAETADLLQEALQPDGLNIGINDREAAGQAIHHTHWHIIPRWHGDGGGSMHSIVVPKEKIDVEAVANIISQVNK